MDFKILETIFFFFKWAFRLLKSPLNPSVGAALQAKLILQLTVVLWQLQRWPLKVGDHGSQWDSAAGLQAVPTLLWYSYHTERRNAKGERSSTSREIANQAKDGREREGGNQGKRKHGEMKPLKWNQKQTLCCNVWFVMGPWLPKSQSCHFVWFLSPPPSLLFFQCMLLFCPMRRPTAASGIPAQWGPYNWESCLLFSPLPPHFLTFFIFSPLICSLSLSEHMDRFSRERPVHIKAWGWAGQFVAALHSSSPSSSLSGLFLHRSHFPRMLHWPSSAA